MRHVLSRVEATYEASKAEMTLSVFHSLMRESIKASHECLNLIRAGETSDGVHSSGKGKGTDATGAVTPRGVERTPGAGGEKVDIGI